MHSFNSNRFIRRILGLVAMVILLGFAPSLTAADKPAGEVPAKPVPIDPKTASLADAITDFGNAIQADDLKLAERWVRDPAVLAGHWARIKAQHKQFGYAMWIEKAKALENRPAGALAELGEAPNRFTVGGHNQLHFHIQWEKTKAGWQIASFMICR